jgi:hypothetical protein
VALAFAEVASGARVVCRADALVKGHLRRDAEHRPRTSFEPTTCNNVRMHDLFSAQ